MVNIKPENTQGESLFLTMTSFSCYQTVDCDEESAEQTSASTDCKMVEWTQKLDGRIPAGHTSIYIYFRSSHKTELGYQEQIFVIHVPKSSCSLR